MLLNVFIYFFRLLLLLLFLLFFIIKFVCRILDNQSEIGTGYQKLSVNFQEVVENSEILSAMSSDHCQLIIQLFFCSFQHFNKILKSFWPVEIKQFFSF